MLYPRVRPIFIALLVAASAGPAAAQAPSLRSLPYVSGLTLPVGMVQDPSDPAIQYVVEQGGLIKVIQNGTVLATPFLDLTTAALCCGERGLLGLAFPSDYARSGRFYVHFNSEGVGGVPAGATIIARFRRSATNPLVADPATRFDLLWPAMPDANCTQAVEQRYICQPYANHNGGKLAFGPDGYLYIALGDGGSGGDPQNQAQQPRTLLGKLLRVDVSVPENDQRGYRIPSGNPFAGADAYGALDEIWAFGVRNPWRLTFDPTEIGGTGAMTFGDVGQGLWEEIDYEPGRMGGRNYGWRIREGLNPFGPGAGTTPIFTPLVDPIFEYGDPFGVNGSTSITGGSVYRGFALGTFFRGRYFYADYISGRIASLALTIDPATRLATASDFREHTAEINGGGPNGNVSSIDIDANGELYIVKYGGQIVRVLPVNGDADGDGLSDDWELRFGLDPASAAGADGFGGDKDGDGVPNNVEATTGTHPNGPAQFTRYLAEGASSSFFETGLGIMNPDTAAAAVLLRFLKDNGTTVSWSVTVAPRRRLTINPGQLSAIVSSAFATIVESDREVVVERTMRWDQTGYGAHTEKALNGPATTWYFAEGSQGFFFTYVLLTNPNGVQNRARVRFLLEGASPFEQTFTIQPFARLTVDPGGYAALRDRSFGIEVTFLDQPGAAERAMYFGTPPDVLWKAGHESAGVTAPATEWFLAEGATGPYFETFILAANPNAQAASITVTYFTSAGQTIVRQKVVPANGRLTINIEAEGDPALANAAVATRVVSTLPIVVERAQYWPFSPPEWQEAHNSFGVTEAATRWGLAEGQVGRVEAAQTYVLLANSNATPVTVTIDFIREVEPPLTKTFTVPANSRFNVSVVAGGLVPELRDERFGAVISASAPIVVERALYYNANGIVWAAGTSATGTRLP